MNDLKKIFYTNNKKRPAHSTEFDINIGLHNLQISEQTDQLKVWKAPLSENVIFIDRFSVWVFGKNL